MARGFFSLRFHSSDQDQEAIRGVTGRSPALRGVGRSHEPGGPARTFNTDEAAARFYLSNLLARDDRPTLRGLTAPDRPEVVPDLRMTGVREVPQTNTRVVRFEQTKSSIPIFGSLAIVEIDPNREFVSVDAELADVGGVSPIATISPAQAAGTVATAIGGDFPPEKIPSPELTFYHDDEHDAWHLAYYFRKVPGAPPDYMAKVTDRKGGGRGFGASPRLRHPLFDYLVDAHDGQMLFFFSATPLVAVPAKLVGQDEEGLPQTFWGNRRAPDAFDLLDPVRLVKTYDFKLGDIDTAPFPTSVITSAKADFGANQKAAVSAHVNATRVLDFYKSVLLRDGVDDKGMELVSVINCTYPAEETPPEWHNACWADNRMWYGQEKVGSGFRSYSRMLDVIAHELTHGVTEYTSDLIYQNQSGALNESFSDIIGVAVKNWTSGRSTSVANWDWEIGAGLGGAPNLPLRDMSDPTRTGDPAHMDHYLHTTSDSGGVHTNSNIHNKAAYNVFTARDEHGSYLFEPLEALTLYYLTLTRLNRTADFGKTLRVLVDVAKTYYAGNAAELAAKTAALEKAYAQVGIQ